MFFDVLRCIIIDFFQPFSYLLVIFAAGVLTAGFFLGIRRVTGWRIRFQISANGLCRVLLLVYLLVLLQTALFSREPGSRYSLDLTLFETWGRSAVSRAYFIENILMYLPFGILAPACFRKLERPWVCVLTAFASSVLLEWIQLLTHRGYCQLDDVVTNTAGALVGWCLWRLRKLPSRVKKNQETASGFWLILRPVFITIHMRLCAGQI